VIRIPAAYRGRISGNFKVTLREQGSEKAESRSSGKRLSMGLLGKRGIPETMTLSEKALAADWDTPEEDEAWANL
jgi:hypothetical protein